MSEPVHYFAKRAKIYPRRTWGRYRKLKWAAMATLLAIYYLTPWLRWDRGAGIPDQAILIDMPARRAYFFFIEIWPQEVYFLTGILILAAVGLFFVTSLLGRVWCGYACPQTVWTDLFIWVERIVQGDRNARMKLDKQRWNLEKLYKKALTHLIWLCIGACTGGAWVFYFNDAPTLADQILHGDVPWSVGIWIIGLTLSTYIMAGFAREQVCTYMCPYARFQSAMFDKDTLIVAYDENRGEPRGKHKAGESWIGKGHCIDCDSCVIVCPAGIDIRNGLQMECIACGLCVDACNHVMDKLDLPHGLIRYDTENNRVARLEARKPGAHILRLRTLWYVAILAVVSTLMVYGLANRAKLEMNIVHDRNPLFVVLSDGSIRNAYRISVLNKTHQDRTYHLQLEGMEADELRVQAAQELTSDSLPVFADSVGHFRVFVTAPVQEKARKNIHFIVEEIDGDLKVKTKSIFMSGGR